MHLWLRPRFVHLRLRMPALVPEIVRVFCASVLLLRRHVASSVLVFGEVPVVRPARIAEVAVLPRIIVETPTGSAHWPRHRRIRRVPMIAVEVGAPVAHGSIPVLHLE
jgi:hypothetical protein